MRLTLALAPVLACALVVVAIAPPVRADVTAPTPAGVPWRTDATAAERDAAKLRRPLLVFFSAEWCMPCKEMMRKSFADPDVAALIARGFVPLVVDMTNDDDAAKAIGDRYHVRALPTLIVVRGAAQKLRLERFLPAAELRAALARIR
jgi:thiol:disulfide interchange protein